MSDRLNSDAFMMLDRRALREALLELQELEGLLSPRDLSSAAYIRVREAIWTLQDLVDKGGDWLEWDIPGEEGTG